MANYSITRNSISIPSNAYQPFKRCHGCQSVFVNDRECEVCGRSVLFHPIGEAFGAKSFFGIKERYVESLPGFIKMYPVFESKNSEAAKSYVRQLSKRFTDLITGFNQEGMIETGQRKFFYFESFEIVDELIRYRVQPKVIESLLEQNDSSLIGQELIYYIHQGKSRAESELHWWLLFNDYRLWGLLRVEFFLMSLMISATASAVAIMLYDLVSLRYGR